MKHVTLRAAFLDTLPVMTGYLFLGFGFGILMQQNGMGIAGAPYSICFWCNWFFELRYKSLSERK